MILALVLLLGAVPTFQAQALTCEDFTYEIRDDGAYITGYSGSATEVTIPAVLGRRAVVGIGDKVFSKCKKLTGVTLPDSLTTIGKNAFYNCKNVRELVIPDSVKTIGKCAFYYFLNAKTIVVGKNVETIGYGGITVAESRDIVEKLESIYFLGNAPVFSGPRFYLHNTVNVYYHLGDTSWNHEFFDKLGSNLVWKPIHFFEGYFCTHCDALNPSFSGTAEIGGVLFKIFNGKPVSKYTGYFTYNGTSYYVSNGRVV